MFCSQHKIYLYFDLLTTFAWQFDLAETQFEKYFKKIPKSRFLGSVGICGVVYKILRYFPTVKVCAL